MQKLVVPLLGCLLAVWGATLAVAEEFVVLPTGQDSILYDHLLVEFDRQDAARSAAVKSALDSPAATSARQAKLRADFTKLVGEFPERSPLNARTVGAIECDGYRIERVVYESRPRHHVTANLYLPADASKPVPGILVPCGHSDNGKASEAYQSVCILLALNGFAALIYDPIGQGERHQLPDLLSHGTNEHTLVGVGSLLVGRSTGYYRIFDGLRSMDYLAARPEVDAARLGSTGNSGGGTMTTWLMAVDDRIAVAAPSCFITTLERLFKTIGPQDCEQHFPGQGPLGIDHADFVTMRAPKPTLILAAERDYFDIGGTRTAAKEAEAVYRLLGQPERVGMFSHNDEHGFSRPRRQAAVQWLRRWLMNDDRPVAEPSLALQKDAALQVTSSKQVVKDFADELTVVDFNRERAAKLREARQPRWQRLSAEERKNLLRRVINLRPDREATTEASSSGTSESAGYTVEKLVLNSADGFPLPSLLCLPRGKAVKRPLTIYVDSAGKAPAFHAQGAVETLVGDGRAVLAVDLRGYGETTDNKKAGAKYQNDAFRTSMLAMHVGRPLLGQRVEDLIAAVDYASTLSNIDAANIQVLAVKRAGPVALHAAVLESRIASLEVRDSIASWESDVVARPGDSQLLELAVPSVLEYYDLPDLAAILGTRLKTH